jgi:chromosome segregation ATPase
MDKLKEEFLKLLDRDLEFRYAVAGYLGLSEILKRLDRLEEGQNKLWENQNRLWEEVKSLREGQNKLWENQNKFWENQNRLWEEIKALREGQNKLWENQNKLWEEIKALREGQNRLWENQNKLWEELKSLREGQNKLWENQNKLWEEVRGLKVTQARLAATIDRLTITIEEESLDVVGRRLKDELGLDIKLGRIFVDDKEINIYGSSDDICVIGEATVRLGRRLVEELEEKIKFLREVKPELIKPKIIKVIYTDYATPEAIDLAKEYGIWILNWKGDITPRKIHS